MSLDNSIAFPNPLRQNHGHTEAVKALVPGVRVIGRVVFTNSARFPQGMPPGVSSLHSLVGDLREELGIELFGSAREVFTRLHGSDFRIPA